jgi:hypothetical protein
MFPPRLAPYYQRRPAPTLTVSANIRDDGSELLNEKSLVATCDLRPPSIAEQMARMVRYPEYTYDDDPEDLSDEEFDSLDSLPISKHETRVQDAIKRINTTKAALAAEMEARKVASQLPATPVAEPKKETPDEAPKA